MGAIQEKKSQIHSEMFPQDSSEENLEESDDDLERNVNNMNQYSMHE